MNLNSVSISGTLLNDSTRTLAKNGKAVDSFILKHIKPNGYVEMFQVDSWGTEEFILQKLQQGQKIAIQGYLARYSCFVGHGERVQDTKIVAQKIDILE